MRWRRVGLAGDSLRDVQSAVVCGEHDHVRDARLVELGEQPADALVQRQLHRAHLRPFGAEVVTHVVVGREADCEEIDRVALPERERFDRHQRSVDGE